MNKKIVYALLTLCSACQAFEYHPDAPGKISNRDLIVAGDTLAGYPIYVDGPDWKFFKYHKGSSTGSAASVVMPSLLMQRLTPAGVFEFAQITTVAATQNTSSGWLGEPCKILNQDFEIARVNEVRGRLDRCAHISLTERRIAGSMKPIVRGFAIETNQDGRYYSVELWFSIDSSGKSAAQFQNDQNFKIKAQSWVASMKNAVVRAASYDKPGDSFGNAESFVKLFREASVTAKQTSIGSATVEVSNESEKRLKEAKSLFDKGLVSQAEYDMLRKKILDETMSK